jgi:hypothetical protein
MSVSVKYDEQQLRTAVEPYPRDIRMGILDGIRCVVCGKPEGTMVPCGTIDEWQIFRHPDHHFPGKGLRDLVNAYLRLCEDWQEHPEHAGTYMQWEDLTVQATQFPPPGGAGSEDRAMLPTDLAAVRQMAREGRR